MQRRASGNKGVKKKPHKAKRRLKPYHSLSSLSAEMQARRAHPIGSRARKTTQRGRVGGPAGASHIAGRPPGHCRGTAGGRLAASPLPKNPDEL